MPTVEKYKLSGTVTSLLTTGLNALANNALAISAAYDNTQGQTGDGYTLCDVELSVTYGTAPTTGTAVAVWFLQSQDGSNYEDGGTSVTPGRPPDVVFPLRNVNTLQLIIRRCFMPWGLFKALLKNDGTGQAMGASGHTLKIRPVTREGV